MKVSIKTICPLLLFIFIAYKYEFELIDKAYKDGFLLMLVIVLLIFIVGLKHRKLEKNHYHPYNGWFVLRLKAFFPALGP